MNVSDSSKRGPGSVPDANRGVGCPDGSLPFDHLIVVMMENHSFDNALGALPIYGQPLADGLTFVDGRATNTNPVGHAAADLVSAFPLTTTEQVADVSQSWNATHAQIDGGTMQGFVRSAGGSSQPMGYYTPKLLPFTYSLANAFAVANRWFCSAPCQTYPNRRFLMAGTASGEIFDTLPGSDRTGDPWDDGTIFDLL